MPISCKSFSNITPITQLPINPEKDKLINEFHKANFSCKICAVSKHSIFVLNVQGPSQFPHDDKGMVANTEATKLVSWWRHQMETSSVLLAHREGNPPVTGGFPHKGQWRGALMFSMIYAWTNGWANNQYAGDLRGHCAHYDVTVKYYNGN